MIKRILEEHYLTNRLHCSYLINTDSAKDALSAIKLFIQQHILTCADLDQSGDYVCIENKCTSAADNITVNQIRDFQLFLYKTSIISGKKIGIIYKADKMTLSASNSCLKLLEDPPDKTHIFLITERLIHIIPTVQSRCSKINAFYYFYEKPPIQEHFFLPMLQQSKNTKQELDFIKKFTVQNTELWIDFSRSIQDFMVHLMKYSISSDYSLSKLALKILNQWSSQSPFYIQNKYQKIQQIINNTNDYNLDLQHSVVLIINTMKY